MLYVSSSIYARSRHSPLLEICGLKQYSPSRHAQYGPEPDAPTMHPSGHDYTAKETFCYNL